MIVEDIDDNASTMTEFRVEPLPALSGMRAVLGQTVDTAMQVQSEGEFLWIEGRYGAFDEVTHQATELKLRVFSGQVEVNKVIQG